MWQTDRQSELRWHIRAVVYAVARKRERFIFLFLFRSCLDVALCVYMAAYFCCLLFTEQSTIVQSTVLRSHAVCLSVCLSVTLVDRDHIGWKSWKLIVWTISPTSSLFVAHRSSTCSQGNMEKFWGENVRSTPTSVTSGRIESTESRDLRWRCGCLFTFDGASRGHLCDSTAFLCCVGFCFYA